MKKPALTAWQELAGEGPGGVITAALNCVRLVDGNAIRTALDELDRAFMVGQALDLDRQPNTDRQRVYIETRDILAALQALHAAISGKNS